MRFSDSLIRRISESLLQALLDRGGTTLKLERGVVLNRIEDVIRANLQDEETLERDAKKLLEAHLQQAPPDVDRHKLLQMIKKRLAEERGIPL